jgi:hypothetical protein
MLISDKLLNFRHDTEEDKEIKERAFKTYERKKNLPIRERFNDEINELMDLQQYLVDRFFLDDIRITFKDVNCGRANYRTRGITMPIWIFDHSTEYAWVYMIHEVVHYILFDNKIFDGHGEGFKLQETALLNELGLKPKYAKAYVHQLTSSYDNGIEYYKRGR